MRVIVTIPLLVILVLFALSNSQPVRVGFWPTDFVFDVPLSLTVLVGMAIAFLFGALFIWVGEIGQRRRARRAEQAARQLRAQVQELETRAVLSPPV